MDQDLSVNACEAVDGAYFDRISEGDGTVAFFCIGFVEGQEATFKLPVTR